MYIPPEEIKQQVSNLAEEVRTEYEGKDPLLVGVLLGALPFLSDLSRALMLPHEVDTCRVRSYTGTSSSGVIRIMQDINADLNGRDVLLVDDVIDTGLTTDVLVRRLMHMGAQSVKVAVIVAKPDDKNSHRSADFVGFNIPDSFVVGYGMDYNERYRDLPFITSIEQIRAEPDRRLGGRWSGELSRRAALPGATPA